MYKCNSMNLKGWNFLINHGIKFQSHIKSLGFFVFNVFNTMQTLQSSSVQDFYWVKKNELPLVIVFIFFKLSFSDQEEHVQRMQAIKMEGLNETKICCMLAVHLFYQLVPGGQVIVDSKMKGIDKFSSCPCKCGRKVNIGNTGIGKIIWLMLYKGILVHFSSCGAHDSVVKGIRPVTQRSLVQTLLWPLDGVCCTLRQGTLPTLSQSTQLQLGTDQCRVLTCDGLVSQPGRVIDSHVHSTWKRGTNTGLMARRKI